jgi:hypothetical protein
MPWAARLAAVKGVAISGYQVGPTQAGDLWHAAGCALCITSELPVIRPEGGLVKQDADAYAFLVLSNYLASLAGLPMAAVCIPNQSVMILRAVGDIVSSMSLYSLGAPVLAS